MVIVVMDFNHQEARIGRAATRVSLNSLLCENGWIIAAGALLGVEIDDRVLHPARA